MDKILTLAGEALFPITRDRHGNPLPVPPSTGFSVPGTIQGEGKLAGMPSLFIRLSGCNLRCIWRLEDGSFSRCDTPFASFDTREVVRIEVSELMELLQVNLDETKHVVITGGEPMLQKDALIELTRRIKGELGLHISIETNGTIFSRELAGFIDLYSISPKLRNSDPDAEKLSALGLQMSGPFKYHPEKRKNLEVIQSFIDFARNNGKDFQLKFVIGRPEDEHEIKEEFLGKLHSWKPGDILLMPLGSASEELRKSARLTMEMAVRNGWRYSPRIHIDLFGNRQGV